MWLSSQLINWIRLAPNFRRHSPRRRQRPNYGPPVEALECRTLLTAYAAATAAQLVADINAATTSGGTNTITLTAPGTSPYVFSTVNNTTDGATSHDAAGHQEGGQPDHCHRGRQSRLWGYSGRLAAGPAVRCRQRRLA